MDFLSQFVVMIVLAICFCLGYIIKHSISAIPNKYIPLIMAIAGVVLNVWINGWQFTPEILLGGLASGLASTGTHQLIRNLFPRQQPMEQEQGVTASSLKKKH